VVFRRLIDKHDVVLDETAHSRPGMSPKWPNVYQRGGFLEHMVPKNAAVIDGHIVGSDTGLD